MVVTPLILFGCDPGITGKDEVNLLSNKVDQLHSRIDVDIDQGKSPTCYSKHRKREKQVIYGCQEKVIARGQ
jgi:hypothetical protein